MNPLLFLFLGLGGALGMSVGSRSKPVVMTGPEDLGTGTGTGTDDTTDPGTDDTSVPDTTEVTPPPGGDPIALGDSTVPVAVMGGRVSTLAAEDHETAQSIRIIEGPEHGNLTINPDNTMALVMTTSDFTGSMDFRYEVTEADGTVREYEQSVTVAEGTQGAGWGQGQHYLLETDSNGDTIVETGDDHRKVFVSDSDDALSRAEIAALEGVDESVITGQWLAQNGVYGATEGLALKPDVGMDLWYSVTGETVAPNSNWLLFEKGYTYDDVGRLISRGIQGEDELHPVHITSWGDGEQPIITSQVRGFQKMSENVVFSDVHLQGGIEVLVGKNLMFDDMTVTKNGFNLQNVDQFTIRDSSIHDIYSDEPADGISWHPFTNRDAGIFSAHTDGLLVEDTLFAQIAWEQGYDPDGDGSLPQPPNLFSHNLYLSDSVLDVTFRDNVTTHAASYGLQARGGAFIEDNLVGETNAGITANGGNFSGDGFSGNYALWNGNVVTSSSYHVATQIGALSRGLFDTGKDSTLLDNIVAHMADPNDPADIALKEYNNGGLYFGSTPVFDNTIVYNWVGTRSSSFDLEQNTDGLDPDILNATTYNTLAQNVLGDPDATADDLVDYLKVNDFDTDTLLAFFKDAFGIDVSETAPGTTHTFIPNALGGGIRWDNRINWDNDTLPKDGDSVELNGNWVTYATNVDLQNLTFGSGGALNVIAGRLDVEGLTTVGQGTATLSVDDAGQFWTHGVAAGDDLDIEVDGGRFANTGDIAGGVSFDITDGQVLLGTGGASTTLEAGDTLAIDGTEAKVGFDGDDGRTAGLYLNDDAVLRFVADADGLETIEEFRSGGFGDAPNVHSEVDLGMSDLQIDVTEIAGEVSSSLLINVDELSGGFETVELIGLGDQQDAELIIDYDADTVSLRLYADGDGTGATFLTTVGAASSHLVSRSPWDVLTANQGTFEENEEELLVEEEEEALVL